MYKKKNNTRLEKSKRPIYWLKTKILLIITACMLGLSNSINEEEKSIFGKQHTIEQQDKKG
ncbi:MAG: hypothetical protein ACI9SI_001227 [Polaribacter sp.]|jgi:hypothetical protein